MYVKVSPPKFNPNISPAKYKLSPSKYNSSSNNARNRNLTMDLNQNGDSNYRLNNYSSNTNIPYSSPNNRSFVPSPYTSPSYQQSGNYQQTNYSSSKNIIPSQTGV